MSEFEMPPKRAKKPASSGTGKENAAEPPAPKHFTVSELEDYAYGCGPEAWGEALAAASGFDFQKLIGRFSDQKKHECWLHGCMVIFDLLQEGRISCATTTQQPPDRCREPLQEVLQVHNIANSLAEAKQSLAAQTQQLQAVSKDVAALHQELQAVKQAPSTALKEQETQQQVRSSILVTGLVSEGVSLADAAVQVQQFIQAEVSPGVTAEVTCVTRMGRPTDHQAPRRLRVELASEAQATAVLRAANNLKTYNQQRKAEKLSMVGLDPFLTRQEAQAKAKLTTQFKQARARGGHKIYWTRCQLFIAGKEVMP